MALKNNCIPMCYIPEFGECFVNYADYFRNKPSDIDTGEEVDKILLREAVEETLSTLSDREQTVIRLYYFEEMSYAQIGEKYNVGKERMRQILHKALRKLRHPFRADPLRQFWSPYPEWYDEFKEEMKAREAKEKEEAENKKNAELQHRLLGDIAFREKEKTEKEALEIANKRKRRAHIKRGLEKQGLLQWWDEQMWNIRNNIDFGLPPRAFSGKCKCKKWNAEYRLNYDKFESLCCQCLTKFWMEVEDVA